MYISLLSTLSCLVNINFIHTYHLPCPDTHPIKHEKIKTKVMNSTFYTMAVSHPGPSTPHPPIGFIANSNALVKVIILPCKSDPHRFFAHSLIFHGKESLEVYVSKYVMDEKEAVFESADEIIAIHVSKGIEDGSNSIDYCEIMSAPIIRFAMVYSGALATMRVYQTCNAKWTWLQISEITYTNMEKSSENPDPLEPFLLEAISELKKKYISVAFRRTNQPLLADLFQFSYSSILFSLEKIPEYKRFIENLPPPQE